MHAEGTKNHVREEGERGKEAQEAQLRVERLENLALGFATIQQAPETLSPSALLFSVMGD